MQIPLKVAQFLKPINNLAIGTTGLVATTARFVNAYKISALEALNWSVSADLEIR